MKNFLLAAGLLFALVSCKVSENITVDQISKTSDLAKMKTFQVVTQKNSSGDITQLNKIFKEKLIENGFSPVDENPDLLIQSVIASANFEKEVLGDAGSSGPGDTFLGQSASSGTSSYFGRSPNFFTKTESGKYGKVIFLIQDAKTSEVLWMGTGTGVLSENQVLKKKDIQSALDQLLASLR